THDQLVVADYFFCAIGPGDGELAGGGVDAAGGGVQPQPHPGGFQVRCRAVGQVAPVRHLTGDVVGDAADGEVRVGIRGDHGDVGAWVQFPGARRGADPCVAAADHDQLHDGLPRVVAYLGGCGTGAPSPGACTAGSAGSWRRGTTIPAASAGAKPG